jgi:hypothetical protein
LSQLKSKNGSSILEIMQQQKREKGIHGYEVVQFYNRHIMNTLRTCQMNKNFDT